MKSSITLALLLLVTVLLVNANYILSSLSITFSQNKFINGMLKYQAFALLLATIMLIFTLKINPKSKLLLRFGDVGTIAVKEKWLGIHGKTSWKRNGIHLSLFISITTALYMLMGVWHTNSLSNFQWVFVPIVILLAITNSFSEEIIYRFAINGGLTGILKKPIVLIVSAVLFGLPHYFGFPSGIIGVILSGVLGYILSKASYETSGIGIAWIIHFLQDVIIFTALFMMNPTG